MLFIKLFFFLTFYVFTVSHQHSNIKIPVTILHYKLHTYCYHQFKASIWQNYRFVFCDSSKNSTTFELDISFWFTNDVQNKNVHKQSGV